MTISRIVYKGFLITCNVDRPVTGQWTAERFGVRLSAGNIQSLGRMVDAKVKETNAGFAPVCNEGKENGHGN